MRNEQKDTGQKMLSQTRYRAAHMAPAAYPGANGVAVGLDLRRQQAGQCAFAADKGEQVAQFRPVFFPRQGNTQGVEQAFTAAACFVLDRGCPRLPCFHIPRFGREQGCGILQECFVLFLHGGG